MMGMKQTTLKYRGTQLPLFIERDEDGMYVVECPVLEGCYTQGKTLDTALKNIREVITLALEERKNRVFLQTYRSSELSLHTITI